MSARSVPQLIAHRQSRHRRRPGRIFPAGRRNECHTPGGALGQLESSQLEGLVVYPFGVRVRLHNTAPYVGHVLARHLVRHRLCENIGWIWLSCTLCNSNYRLPKASFVQNSVSSICRAFPRPVRWLRPIVASASTSARMSRFSPNPSPPPETL